MSGSSLLPTQQPQAAGAAAVPAEELPVAAALDPPVPLPPGEALPRVEADAAWSGPEVVALDTDPSPPAQGAPLRGDSLGASVLMFMSLTAVQRLVGLVRVVLFCRWLTAEQLGVWDLAFGFLMLSAPAAVLGLPGAFGRYTEHFRRRGQLKRFIRQTAWATAGLTLAAMLLLLLLRRPIANLAFGTKGHEPLFWLLAPALGVVVATNYVTALLNALRLVRVVSVVHFVQSLSFAVLASAGLVWISTTPECVVVCFAASVLVGVAGAVSWLRRELGKLTEPAVGEPAPLWRKLAPFALWIWLTNWLVNLFDLADRYLIVHLGPWEPLEALAVVGQYHSARAVPLLFVGLAELVVGLITPHLAYDWERGRRDLVSVRLNLILKLLGLGLVLASTGVLVLGDFLFDVALGGKYNAGRAMLPYALTFCAWFGLANVSLNYLWCAEKARLGSLAMLAGLVASVVLGCALVPWLGLAGVILARLAANGTALAVAIWLSSTQGFRCQKATLLVLALPLLVSLGPWPALAATGALLLTLPFKHGLFTTEEKDRLVSIWPTLVRKVLPCSDAVSN